MENRTDFVLLTWAIRWIEALRCRCCTNSPSAEGKAEQRDSGKCHIVDDGWKKLRSMAVTCKSGLCLGYPMCWCWKVILTIRSRGCAEYIDVLQHLMLCSDVLVSIHAKTLRLSSSWCRCSSSIIQPWWSHRSVRLAGNGVTYCRRIHDLARSESLSLTDRAWGGISHVTFLSINAWLKVLPSSGQAFAKYYWSKGSVVPVDLIPGNSPWKFAGDKSWTGKLSIRSNLHWQTTGWSIHTSSGVVTRCKITAEPLLWVPVERELIRPAQLYQERKTSVIWASPFRISLIYWLVAWNILESSPKHPVGKSVVLILQVCDMSSQSLMTKSLWVGLRSSCFGRVCRDWGWWRPTYDISRGFSPRFIDLLKIHWRESSCKWIVKDRLGQRERVQMWLNEYKSLRSLKGVAGASSEDRSNLWSISV